MSSLLYSLQTNCGNCGKANQICTISVAYRCIDCRYINCLMCNKIHDNACELFSKSNKEVSISSTNAIDDSIGEISLNKKKRSLNIQELDLAKNSDGSVPSKKAKMKRRNTIATYKISVKEPKQAEKPIKSEYKCKTCTSYFKNKSGLSRHMKTIKHLSNLNKSLSKDADGTSGTAQEVTKNQEETSTLAIIKVDHVSSAETVVNNYGED